MHRFVTGAALVMALAACGSGGSKGQGGGAGHGGSTGHGGGTTSSTSTSSGAGGHGGAASASSASSSSTAASSSSSGGTGPDISADAVKLCELVNDYRAQNGLPTVPLSTALMTVAAYHVGDEIAHPEAHMGTCNLHSWSTGSPLWTGCCFTPDFAQAQCMWQKPSEITASWGPGKTYTATGYEDAAAGVGSPDQALALWKADPPHDDVILNKDIWASHGPWPAMGCGMAGGYAVLWFGDAADSQTYVP